MKKTSWEDTRKIFLHWLSNNQLKSTPEFIAKIGNLKTLDLRGNPIPKHEIDILKILMPQCQILID